jgi:hypothetical protein
MSDQLIECINRSKFLLHLTNIGIDIEATKDAAVESVDENEIEPFANRSHQLLSPNIYVESLVFKHVCQYLYEEYKDSVIFENDIKLDIKTIIATSRSLIQRPNITNPSNVVEGFKEPDHKDDFVIISRFERELITERHEGRRKQKGNTVFEGLLPYGIEINPLVDKSPTHHIWENNYYFGEPFIQGFYANFNSIEAQYVLWMNSLLLNMLELKLDNYNNGLRALNSNNEIILQFRYWRDQLIGNGNSFVGTDSNIAKLEGCDLILREDYFEGLKQIIPDVVFYTKKI